MILVLVLLSISGFAYYKRDSFSKYFKSKPQDCIPYDVLVNKDNDVYSITWKTKSKCSGFVKYGEFTDNLNYTGTNVGASLSASAHHVTLEKKWETSYFVVISDGKPYGLGTSPMILN